MRRFAQAYVDKLRRSAPRRMQVMTRKIEAQDILFSARFVYFSNVVLHTKNVSSIQKFERSDHTLIDDPVRERINHAIFAAVAILALSIALAWYLDSMLALATATLAAGPVKYAWDLNRILKRNDHRRNDYYIEVFMNSGRRHRFYTGKETTADSIVHMFLTLISSDDTGQVYRLDQSTNTIVVDHSDRSLTNIQIGSDLTYEGEREADDEK